MHGNNKENILCSSIELENHFDFYSMISLNSSKIDIIIIGGGRAGYIKAKGLVENGCRVFVVSKSFTSSFKEIDGKNNLHLIEDCYKKDYIIHKHLIIIATNDEKVNESIRKDCDSLYKIYIDVTCPKESLAIMPCQRETKEMIIALQNKKANPKTTTFLAEKIKIEIEKYGDYLAFSSELRRKLKGKNEKIEIMNFISNDDFVYFFKKNRGDVILNMFYGGFDFEFKTCYQKK